MEPRDQDSLSDLRELVGGDVDEEVSLPEPRVRVLVVA
jgi:hypothetical protein